ERGRDRLVDLPDALEAERRERRLVALHRERRVGTAAGIRDGAADDDVARKRVELRRCMGAHLPEERREQVLEAIRAAVDAGGLEKAACRERLERLDEATVRGVL